MTEAEQKPIPKKDEPKPVAWTPEDASRFLTSAIHEAQRPLAEALKQRPITSKALTLIVGTLVVAAAVIALILSSQIEKAEKRAETAGAARDAIFTEKAELQGLRATLEDRIKAAQSQQDALHTQISTLQGSEEALRKARGDIQRFRRQNELLRSQISGLELEKTALARQLEAVRALAIDEQDDATSLDDIEISDETFALPGEPDQPPMEELERPETPAAADSVPDTLSPENDAAASSGPADAVSADAIATTTAPEAAVIPTEESAADAEAQPNVPPVEAPQAIIPTTETEAEGEPAPSTAPDDEATVTEEVDAAPTIEPATDDKVPAENGTESGATETDASVVADT